MHIRVTSTCAHMCIPNVYSWHRAVRTQTRFQQCTFQSVVSKSANRVFTMSGTRRGRGTDVKLKKACLATWKKVQEEYVFFNLRFPLSRTQQYTHAALAHTISIVGAHSVFVSHTNQRRQQRRPHQLGGLGTPLVKITRENHFLRRRSVRNGGST